MQPRLTPLAGIRAVLFDVYGTLLVSASGDIDVADLREEAASRALTDGGVELEGSGPSSATGPRAVELFTAVIREHHARARRRGIHHPEVDIVEVWREIVRRLEREGLARPSPRTDPRRCALSFELACNPVYPMPGMRSVLEKLSERGLALGIVSNAQFFTPLIMGHILGGGPKAPLPLPLFASDLLVYSYRHLRAKPDPYLFHLAGRALGRRGIAPHEALYLGNDMLNDVYAAAQAGLHTALFAGDARSLRLREDRPETAGLEPDAVLTDLRRLPGLLRG